MDCISIKLYSRCRRGLLASHFGERWDGKMSCNGMCDNCKTNAEGMYYSQGISKRELSRLWPCVNVVRVWLY